MPHWILLIMGILTTLGFPNSYKTLNLSSGIVADKHISLFQDKA